jgi:hypothetical protein
MIFSSISILTASVVLPEEDCSCLMVQYIIRADINM